MAYHEGCMLGLIQLYSIIWFGINPIPFLFCNSRILCYHAKDHTTWNDFARVRTGPGKSEKLVNFGKSQGKPGIVRVFLTY